MDVQLNVEGETQLTETETGEDTADSPLNEGGEATETDTETDDDKVDLPLYPSPCIDDSS